MRLTPIKARIFDVIRRSGRGGIDRDDLFDVVFGDRKVKRTCLKSHIWQINDLIEDAGHKIIGGRSFKLVKLP